jgi:hypothetical protein
VFFRRRQATQNVETTGNFDCLAASLECGSVLKGFRRHKPLFPEGQGNGALFGRAAASVTPWRRTEPGGLATFQGFE